MKKNILFVLAAALTMSMTFSGCGGSTSTEASAETTTTVAEKEETKEPEVEKETEKPIDVTVDAFLKGIKNRYVLIDSKDIDYLREAEYSKNIVTDVAVDDSGVDTAKAGEYTVRYTVTVNKTNLEKAKVYIAQHPEIYGEDAAETAVADVVVEEKVEAPAAEESEGQDADIAEDNDGEKPEDAEGADVENADADTQADAEDADAEETSAEQTDVKEADAEEPTDADDAGAEDVDSQKTDEESVAPKETEGAADAEGTEQDKENILPEVPADVFEKEEGDTTPDETEEVVIEKIVTIVTPEEAVEIIDNGEEVWKDNSEPVTKEDLVVVVPEEEKKEETKEEKPVKEEEPEDRNENTQASEKHDSDDSRNDDDDRNDNNSRPASQPEQKHVHNWVEKTKTVHHDAEGHYEKVQTGTETVVDEPAWDEPVYEWICECNECGAQFDSSNDAIEHTLIEHGGASYSNREIQVDTIHHAAVTHEEPVYEDQWHEDSPAYDEEVTTGYYCSECGAIR